ncbi:DNA polymerase III subunit delta [Candidatus Erwinia haradaeae]|uniref:DNA polymerase III subunit delta n=1 Tax=Candidatus Erwinia haradaeae TaxID=1922217 RepID=A0A451D286_9GAMM|nr:DNA polymerase III subunit delta [Candidatus Erwinia haradaeae]VFP79753.1 DNA polymerase III subunit delta [Candidatus Erwinia haradaeae]
MIKIYPEYLDLQLKNKLFACYLLHGNEPLLIQEAQNSIFSTARQQGFNEHSTIMLDCKTNWQSIFSICKSLSLLGNRRTLLLILPENGPTSAINTQLTTLCTFLHKDILLVLKMSLLTKIQKKSKWYKILRSYGVEISCQTIQPQKLSFWIASRAKILNIDIDDSATKILCYYYEGNLLALSQVLEHICILYRNHKIKPIHIENIVNDSAHFTPHHWVDALLLGKSKRAIHILHQIFSEDKISITILLRILQRDLFLLITMKRKILCTPLYILFNQYRVLESRRTVFSIALQRFQYEKLCQIFSLLTKIELLVKQYDNQSILHEFETLTMTSCEINHPFNLSTIELPEKF